MVTISNRIGGNRKMLPAGTIDWQIAFKSHGSKVFDSRASRGFGGR